MSLVAEPSDVERWHGPLEVQVTFETALGLLATFFIGFFVPVVFGVLSVVAFAQGRVGLLFSLVPLMLATGWLALLIAKTAAEASMGRLYDAHDLPPQIDPELPIIRLPFALAMAARLPIFNWFWRPWIVVWWMAHFCAAAVIGHTVAVGLIRRFDVATVLVAIPLAVMIHFAFLFASNLYLVLASRAVADSPRLCVRVWKYRFAIDLIVAMLLLMRGVR